MLIANIAMPFNVNPFFTLSDKIFGIFVWYHVTRLLPVRSVIYVAMAGSEYNYPSQMIYWTSFYFAPPETIF